jgi:ABC-2 type transport system ATP-binding protein
MNNTVEIVGLTRRYGSRRGIENVSLLINEGEIVGLLGPNGCGKTTLIKLVMGLLQPDEGSVSILGLKPTKNAYDKIIYTTVDVRESVESVQIISLMKHT